MIERLTANWPLKLLSVGLAYAIWLAVTGETRIVQDFNVPVDLVLGADTLVAGPRPTRVTVRLRGPETLLRRVDPLRLELSVDLRDAGPGERNVQLHASDVVGVPAGIEVDYIEPDRMTLTIARRATKTVAVKPSYVGKPAEGYAFYGDQVLPDAVEVEGPEKEVAGVTRLRTDPIRLDGRAESFEASVAVVPDNPEVRVLNPRPVRVRVEIDRAPVEVRFDAVPVFLAGQVYESRVTPPRLSVTLSGPPGLLRGIDASQLRAVADVTGLAPRSRAYSVPVRLEILDVPARDLTRINEKTRRSSVEVVVTDRRISE